MTTCNSTADNCSTSDCNVHTVGGHRGVDRTSKGLLLLDNISGVLWNVYRAGEKGLYKISELASHFMNLPIVYTLMFIPGITLTMVNIVLNVTGHAKDKRSIHSTVMEVVTGYAMLGLTIAMLCGVPGLNIATSTIGLFKGLWNLTTHVGSMIRGTKKIEMNESPKKAREHKVEAINRAHNIAIAGLTLTAAIFLLIPPLAPIGAAILLATTVYGLAASLFEWKFGANPFKWVVAKIANAIWGEPSEEPKPENTKLLGVTAEEKLSSSAKTIKFVKNHPELEAVLTGSESSSTESAEETSSEEDRPKSTIAVVDWAQDKLAAKVARKEAVSESFNTVKA